MEQAQNKEMHQMLSTMYCRVYFSLPRIVTVIPKHGRGGDKNNRLFHAVLYLEVRFLVQAL